MKNILIKSTAVLALSSVLFSCTEDFETINTDPLVLDQSAITNSPLLQGQAFAFSQFTAVNGGAGEFQLSQNLFSDIWAQYYATTAAGFESDRYEQVGRWSDAAWRFFYGDAAPQLKLVEDITAENGNAVGNAMTKIWRVHSYQRMTDHWGPIPYSEFGNGELSVPFDSQESIYADFFNTLDEAVAQLNANPGGTSFTEGDLIYTGNGDSWLKFANSLRLRVAMRIRFVDPGKAQAEAEKAVAAGVFEDNSENANLSTDDVNRNPLSTITNWGEFRMSATMESILEGYEDPRLAEYFAPAVDGDSDDDGSPYEGLLNGQARIDLETSKNANHSDLGIQFIDPAQGGTNPAILIMNTAEVFFLRAEGALAGWNMGGNPADLYAQGIRASLAEKSGASDAAVNTYIASSNTPVPYQAGALASSDIPVAFAADAETQLEQIITQKWIANYPNGWESWAELRRTGYPKTYARAVSQNPDVPVDAIIRRMVYTSTEFDNNEASVNAAIQDSELGGADKNNTKLWWDKK